jgi:hypothetical protein
MADVKQKKPGRTYNLKVKIGEKWTPLGNVFIRDDKTGGAVFLKKEDFLKACPEVDEKGQVVLSLFPHEPKADGNAPEKSGVKPEAKSEAA